MTVSDVHDYLRARIGHIVPSKITNTVWTGVKSGRLHRQGYRLRVLQP